MDHVSRITLNTNSFVPTFKTQLRRKTPDEEDTLKELDLSNKGLLCLPGRWIFGYTPHNIVSIELANNHIYSIPEEISLCSQLKSLDLSNNCISQIGRSLSQNIKLKKLNIAFNKVNAILDDDLSSLASLEMLVLSKNRIISITQNISRLINLKYLSIDGNCFQELPCSLGFLPNMSELKLDWGRYIPLSHSEFIRSKEVHERRGDCCSLYILRAEFEELCMKMMRFNGYVLIDDFITYFSDTPLNELPIEYYRETLRTAIDRFDQGIALWILQKRQLKSILRTNEYTRDIIFSSMKDGREAIAIQLVQSDIPTNLINQRGETILHVAVKTLDFDLVTSILSLGINVDAVDLFGNTALHLLFSSGFGKHKLYNTVKRSTHGITRLRNPFFLGSESMNEHPTNTLITPRTQINRSSIDGVFEKEDEIKDSYRYLVISIAKAILRNDANPNTKNRKGLAPWHEIIKRKDLRLLLLIREAGDDFNMINWKCSIGDSSIIHSLAAIPEPRVLFEFLENEKCSPIELDSNCRLPIECIVFERNYTLRHKLLLRKTRSVLSFQFKEDSDIIEKQKITRINSTVRDIGVMNLRFIPKNSVPETIWGSIFEMSASLISPLISPITPSNEKYLYEPILLSDRERTELKRIIMRRLEHHIANAKLLIEAISHRKTRSIFFISKLLRLYCSLMYIHSMFTSFRYIFNSDTFASLTMNIFATTELSKYLVNCRLNILALLKNKEHYLENHYYYRIMLLEQIDDLLCSLPFPTPKILCTKPVLSSLPHKIIT